MNGKIIILNGASSSGKSSIARALQSKIDEPFWHFSIDHLRAAKVLPLERIVTGEFVWKNHREAFFDGFHRCIPALAGAGNNLIIEHIVETKVWMQRLLLLLDCFDVFFVGVHCPLDELERRERERGDRRVGEARADFEVTHTFGFYDFEVLSTLPVEENVSAIISAWKNRDLPSAFERMNLENRNGA